MAHVLILSGGGRYSDPWHKFADTSECLAELAKRAGCSVEITFDVAEALSDLEGVDVIVANAARAQDDPPDEATLAAAAAGLDAHVALGGGALGLHVGVSTLTGLDQWREVMGGYWLKGVSMHPPLGLSHVVACGEQHCLTEGIGEFDLVDERYTHMQVAPELEIAAFHELEGQRHPLVWSRNIGPARVVADCLGHSVESFESEEHRLILQRAFSWLAESR